MIAILNAILSPLVAALRLPFTLAAGFVAVLLLDALVLLLASRSTLTRSAWTGSDGRFWRRW